MAGQTAVNLVSAFARAAIIAASVVGAGAISQLRHERRSARLAPPGQAVDVDGVGLHYRDVGTGSPTVVFEAGAGGTLDSWALVVPQVAAVTRTIAYDRAGIGFSDPAAAPDDRRPLAVALRLRGLLQAIGARPPYVMVGHSLGGLAVRAFADRWPDEVAGLVLVDPSHEEMETALGRPPFARRLIEAGFKGVLDGANRLARLGTPRLLSRLLVPRRLGRQLGLGDAEVNVARARYGRVACLRAVTAEHQQLDAALVQARLLRVRPDVPVTVLSGDRLDASRRRAHIRRAMNELHAELAGRSAAGRHVVVADCGHLVPIEHPDAVVAATLAMVSAVVGA